MYMFRVGAKSCLDSSLLKCAPAAQVAGVRITVSRLPIQNGENPGQLSL
jgi:hypothetical protein